MSISHDDSECYEYISGAFLKETEIFIVVHAVTMTRKVLIAPSKNN